MKKTLTVLIIVIAFTLCFFGSVSAEEVVGDVGTGKKVYQEVENISLNYKDRTAGFEGEKAFAEYLKGRFSRLGYEDTSYGFKFDNFLKKNASYESENVIFKKESDKSDKHVIIMSGYSNLYGYEEAKNNEAIYYGGAMGVGMMLTIAENLKDVELDYDVYFVGLGANAIDYAGAMDFYEHFYIKNNKSDTLLVMNYTIPVGGDNIYMYTDEVTTIHGEYLDNVAKKCGSAFTSVPSYKKSVPLVLIEDQIIPYTHAGVGDSQINFLNARIPSVNFVSLNWEKPSFSMLDEREGFDNVMNTKNDTLEYLVENVGKDKLISQLSSVYNTSFNALTDKEFESVMTKSIENMPNYAFIVGNTFYMIVMFVVSVIVLAIAAFVVIRANSMIKDHSVRDYVNDCEKYFGNDDAKIEKYLGEKVIILRNMLKASENKRRDPFAEFSTKENDGDDIFGL